MSHLRYRNTREELFSLFPRERHLDVCPYGRRRIIQRMMAPLEESIGSRGIDPKAIMSIPIAILGTMSTPCAAQGAAVFLPVVRLNGEHEHPMKIDLFQSVLSFVVFSFVDKFVSNLIVDSMISLIRAPLVETLTARFIPAKALLCPSREGR